MSAVSHALKLAAAAWNSRVRRPDRLACRRRALGAVARWLTTESRERDAVAPAARGAGPRRRRAHARRARRLLPAPTRAAAPPSQADAAPAAARARRRSSPTTRRPPTRSASATGPTRVAWTVVDAGLPVVQCVLVRRGGSALAGRTLPCCGSAPRSATSRAAEPSHVPRSRLVLALSARRSSAAARRRRARAGRRRPVGRRALQERPERPLPDRRPLAVPARHDGHGLSPACAASHRGWTSPTSRTRGTPTTSASSHRHVGWYRKDFKLPQRRAGVAGSSASSRSTTARGSGSTASRSAATRGAYLPFELRLPRHGAASAPGTTGSSSASTTGAPPTTSRPRASTTTSNPTGGWWNYGGLLREVYLRRVQRRGLLHRPGAARPAVLRPAPRPCPSARRSATSTRAPGRVRVTGTFGASAGQPRHGDGRRRRALRRSQARVRVRQARACGRRQPEPLRRELSARVGGARRPDAGSPTRHPLDQGRRRPPLPQRPRR